MSSFYQLLKFHLFVNVNSQCWNFSLYRLKTIQLNAQQTYSQFIALKCWSRFEAIYFCSCSHISALTLTDLFRHEIRIMLMLHSVARLSLSSSDRIHRLRLSCCRSTYTHGKKPFLLITLSIHRCVLLKFNLNNVCSFVWTCNSFDYPKNGYFRKTFDRIKSVCRCVYSQQFDMLQTTLSALALCIVCNLADKKPI